MAAEHWEASEARTFLGLLDHHDVVVDIGANIGFYSCLAASRSKRVLSFEPSRRNLRYLKQNLRANGYRSVEVLPIGLADESGLASISGFGGIASFVPGWAQNDGASSEVVPVTTLDCALAGRFVGERLLIKVDVEGFELKVLTGAGETLRRTPRPTWLAEILLTSSLIPGGTNKRFQETFELFWSLGYECRTLDGADSLITIEDVKRWVKNRSIPANNHDFLFRQPDSGA